MKKILMMAIMAVMTIAANAQDEVEATVSADFVSRYIWRGQALDKAAVQPTAGISYKGLSLSAWGSYGIQSDAQLSELDLTLAYTSGGLNVGITDFWNDAANSRYFLYDSHKTGHTFEANVGYDFGALSVQWYTIFAGFDGLTEQGKRAYTSYFEIAAPFTLGGLDWKATLGAVPYTANGGYYADVNSRGFAVTNVSLMASKDLKITDSFTLPVFAAINTNPSVQKAAFVFGFTVKP